MIGSLVYLVIYLIVIGAVLWLLTYLVDSIPLQPPFARVAKIVITIVGVLIIILVLLNFAGMLDGGGPPRLR